MPVIKEGIIEYKNGVPQMVMSLLHPKYKNLYTYGLGQPRWGAGSLIVCIYICNVGIMYMVDCHCK